MTERSDSTTEPARRPPLAGVRVVECSMLGPGAVTTHLADLGADVIKVEPPSGDYIREMTWPIVEGVSLMHLHISRGKRSVDVCRKVGVRVLQSHSPPSLLTTGAPRGSIIRPDPSSRGRSGRYGPPAGRGGCVTSQCRSRPT